MISASISNVTWQPYLKKTPSGGRKMARMRSTKVAVLSLSAITDGPAPARRRRVTETGHRRRVRRVFLGQARVRCLWTTDQGMLARSMVCHRSRKDRELRSGNGWLKVAHQKLVEFPHPKTRESHHPVCQHQHSLTPASGHFLKNDAHPIILSMLGKGPRLPN
jgi:hypothetical protein